MEGLLQLACRSCVVIFYCPGRPVVLPTTIHRSAGFLEGVSRAGENPSRDD